LNALTIKEAFFNSRRPAEFSARGPDAEFVPVTALTFREINGGVNDNVAHEITLLFAVG